jgi:DNA-directed RNA polymerase N-terminal
VNVGHDEIDDEFGFCGSVDDGDISSLQTDIDKLTQACLLQLLPNDNNDDNDNNSNTKRRSSRSSDLFTTIDRGSMSSGATSTHSHSNFYDNDENESLHNENSLTSLDHELGIGSIWDVETDDEILQEEEDGDHDYEVKDIVNSSAVNSHTTEKLPSLSSSSSSPSARPINQLHTTEQSRNRSRPFPFKTPMDMLRSFDSDNPPSSGDPLELQLWMECWSQREAVLKHQQLVDKARDRKAYDAMSLMQRYVIDWFEELKNSIDSRQKEYLSLEDKRRAHKRYGPFLCSLHPEKMAVIATQEAITQSLLNTGKTGLDGVPLVKMAYMIGLAVETEVVSQRQMKERFHKSVMSLSDTSIEEEEDNETVENSDDSSTDHAKSNIYERDEMSGISAEKAKVDLFDKWKFSASHLKLFLDDLERTGMGRNKRGIQYAMKKAKQAMNSGEAWTTDDLVHVGAALLSILVDNAKVRENGKEEQAFRVEKKWLPGKKTKSQSFIVMHDRVQKAFLEDEYFSWAANTTRHTPMIVPPTDWSGPNEGGYKWLKTDLMRTHGSSVQKEALQQADLSVVCEGLNILGKTPWRINKKILEVGEYCWNNNVPIGDIPSRTDFEVPPEPVRPSYIDPEVFADRESAEAKAAVEDFRAYNSSVYRRKRICQKNMDLQSLRCSAMLKLNQAKRFQDFERIYFPYNLDFRGRACKFVQLSKFLCNSYRSN